MTIDKQFENLWQGHAEVSVVEASGEQRRVGNCDPEGNFRCGDQEHALRFIVAEQWTYGPMTPEQRQWCIQEADSAGEGSWSEEELAKLNDKELANAVLQAWADYVRSNCL